MSKKATRLAEINQAVNFDEPIGPDHPFFTDFSHVRGDFEEQIVYANLNVDIDGDNLRFIKDPNIVASSFFVQKPERVAALAFVMTTCLLVYSALEYRIRQALENEDKTVPDQKGKPTKKPTTRWVFQLFVGIHVLVLPDGKKFTLNLNTNHRNILSLLSYWDFYS